ncbi:MAG: hypothetical protein JRG96_16170 [Deltaproteobacteria bacterium]|nr:hypothetical protein [Deltaproteobacteria bacterium]MBW2421565.1 hypothetical protein [Deltaproteobacteria bacterium]
MARSILVPERLPLRKPEPGEVVALFDARIAGEETGADFAQQRKRLEGLKLPDHVVVINYVAIPLAGDISHPTLGDPLQPGAARCTSLAGDSATHRGR